MFIQQNIIDYRILDTEHIITVRKHKTLHHIENILNSKREISLKIFVVENSPFEDDITIYCNNKKVDKQLKDQNNDYEIEMNEMVKYKQ